MITQSAFYTEYLARKTAEYGSKFDPSDLAPAFRLYFRTGERIRVTGPLGTRAGTVGVTGGFKPAFLLMHRRSDVGSWDLLTTEDAIVAVKRGRTYVPVTSAELVHGA